MLVVVWEMVKILVSEDSNGMGTNLSVYYFRNFLLKRLSKTPWLLKECRETLLIECGYGIGWRTLLFMSFSNWKR
jgi:hypothetical protein